jgi:hypothetical protein
MDAVQLDLAGSDRSVVFMRVRTNPTSQVFASFRVQWTRALKEMARIGQAGTEPVLQNAVSPSFVLIGQLLRDS